MCFLKAVIDRLIMKQNDILVSFHVFLLHMMNLKGEWLGLSFIKDICSLIMDFLLSIIYQFANSINFQSQAEISENIDKCVFVLTEAPSSRVL